MTNFKQSIEELSLNVKSGYKVKEEHYHLMEQIKKDYIIYESITGFYFYKDEDYANYLLKYS